MSMDSKGFLTHLPPDKEFLDGLQPGSLYLVATPIGNLRDISIRALQVLSLVDVIAAEDTRRAGILLRAYGIQKPLISCYAHVEEKQSQHILSLLEEGKTIAMVSDAGMPGISDPGTRLVKQAVDAGVKLCVIPGASAGITALTGSGLDTDTYVFCGFFPRSSKDRHAWLERFVSFHGTLVFYESPKRLLSTLRFLLQEWGDRRCCVARELTKHFEDYSRGSLSELIELFSAATSIKGEIVVVIEGQTKSLDLVVNSDDMEQLARELLESGLRKKEASRQLAYKTGQSVRFCYDFLVKMT